MVTSQKTKEEETMEQYSLLLTRNLLWIAIYNISYIRGLFPEKYFNDKSVPALGMSIKKLMPMDAESRRLIDWTEQGVWDALQKKHLKTLLFCICEMDEGQVVEEYAFSFSYPKSSDDEVIMELSLMGSKVNGATFKLNAAEVTPDRMRSSAYIMIRTLVSLTRTLDQTPDERTILMKQLYYDDVTWKRIHVLCCQPEDYEPPFFKCCADNQAISIWNKNPLKMELGNVKNKHLVLALKVDVHLDPYDDSNAKREDEKMSLEYDNQDEDSSDTEVNLANSFGRLCCVSKRAPLFHLDSGATHHICVNESYMKDLRTIKEHQRVTVTSADGKDFTAAEIGTIAYPSFNLSQVPFMPSMPINVVSIGQLDKQGLLISICNGEFHIIDVKNSTLVGEGYRHVTRNDYVFRAIDWVLPMPKDQTDVGQLDIGVPQTNSVSKQYNAEKDWVIDSCCPCHMAANFEMLTNHTGSKQKFHTPKG